MGWTGERRARLAVEVLRNSTGVEHHAGGAWEPCPQVRTFFAGTGERMPKWPDRLGKRAWRAFRYEVSQGGKSRDADGHAEGGEAGNESRCRRPPHCGHCVMSIPSKIINHWAAV